MTVAHTRRFRQTALRKAEELMPVIDRIARRAKLEAALDSIGMSPEEARELLKERE